MKNKESDGLELLFDISKLLSDSDQLEMILKPVMDHIALTLNIVRGMITILNRTRGEIAIAEAWGLDGSQKSRGRYSLGEGITGKVIETGNPVAIKRLADEPRFLNKTGARKSLEAGDLSFVCVPIRIGVEVIGAIGIDLPQSVSEPVPSPEPANAGEAALEYELRLLTIVAASISQAAKLNQIRAEEADLKTENTRLQAQLRSRFDFSTFVIGNSKIMRDLYLQMEQVSGASATVLLLGESGVGKERIAQALHYTSPRQDKPLIKVNCAAIPEPLIESALFGHEKGAFTGAAARRTGYFEQAHSGTIFLDEIAEMPLSSQSKFLRVLQEREFERIGGSETIKVNIRVIAATNRDLYRLIREGKFREDLYYRLSVFPLVIPPLRERKTDIMLLANHFVEKFAAENGKPIHHISPGAVHLMNAYAWPGNVRELENCIERAVILSTDGFIDSGHLPPSVQQKEARQGERKQTLKEALESVERLLIAEEFRWTRGNVARAAANLGISERVMGLRVIKYGLKKTAGEEPG